MFDRLTFYSNIGFLKPCKICCIVYFSAIAYVVFLQCGSMLLVSGFMMLLRIIPTTADNVAMFMAGLMGTSAWCVTIAGTFLLRRTTKVYAVGWLCYAVQILLSCIVHPFINTDSETTDLPVYLPLMYLVLMLCNAVIGIMLLLGRGNKWIMLGSALLGAVLFVATLFLGRECYVGTMGVLVSISWEYDNFEMICVIAANTALFASAALAALSHKTTQLLSN